MSSLEAQLSGSHRPWRMFTHRPKSQNFCDPALWEAGLSPPCGSQNLPASGPIPIMTLDPVQVKLLGT